MRRKITDEQIIEYWKDYAAEHGCQPTLREACRHLHVAIPTLIGRLQKLLVKGSMMRSGNHKSRSWYATACGGEAVVMAKGRDGKWFSVGDSVIADGKEMVVKEISVSDDHVPTITTRCGYMDFANKMQRSRK